MQISQSLSKCIRFHNLIQQLYENGDINLKEKNKLKQDFNSNNDNLFDILEDEFLSQTTEGLKQQLVDYAKNIPGSNNTVLTPGIRRRSLLSDLSPMTGKKSAFFKDSKITDDLLLAYTQQLKEALTEVLQTRSNALTAFVYEQLKSLTALISKLPSKSPLPSLILLQDINITDEIENSYKTLKKQFINAHSLLINDSVISVTQNLVSTFLNCDQFSILSTMNGLYDSSTHQFKQINMDEYLQDLLSITTNINQLNETNINLNQLFKYQKTYTLRIQDEFYFFHQNKERDTILNCVSEFKCLDELKMLSSFLSKTLQEARVQTFSPLQIGNMILDIGAEFVRCSKYLLISQFINHLKSKFTVERSEGEIQGSYTSINSTNPSPCNLKSQKVIKIQFRDILPIEISIHGINLNKKEDFSIFKAIHNYYNKYLQLIELSYDRITFYKYFIKSKDSIMIEFDKEGLLTFVSRPIPPSLSKEFNLQYEQGANYYIVIQNEDLLKEIEQHIQNKWTIQQNDQLYEIFLKVRNKKFKGFAIIFSEGFIQTRNLEAETKKFKLRQEATQYLSNLEQNNPDFKDTILSFYMPQQISSTKTQIKKKKSVVKNGCLETLQINLIDLEQLIEISECQQDIDSFQFNIFNIENNSIQKQRVVYQIIKANHFLEIFDIEKYKLCEFLSELEYRYDKKKNNFHNYNHGVNVMHSCHVIMNKLLLIDQMIFDAVTQLALIFGGLCHDVGHTGRTNVFEINNLSEKAIRYHDKNVLEQYHAATALKMMLKERMNFLRQLDFRVFREKFIQNILYTDKAEHFNLLKFFENNNERDIKVITGMILHTADFAGGAAKWPISKKWSLRVNQEFQAQYEEEGRLGLPQQQFMKDLDKISVLSKSEIGFYKFIVRPLYVALSKFMNDQLQDRIENIDETIIEWTKLGSICV